MPVAAIPDDATLVAVARENPTAFAPLYDRYARPICRYCYLRLDDPMAAEDATSEVFLKALAALPQYRDGHFAAWLFQIAHNVVLDAHRRHRSTEPIDGAPDLTDPDPTPEDIAMGQARWDALQLDLAMLPEQQRRAVELQIAGWSVAQSADALRTSPGTVKVLRHRALTRLRALMARPGRDTAGEAHHGST